MFFELFVVLVALAITLILIGVALITISMFTGGKRTEETEVGGVIIIGPVPIAFGSSLRAIKAVLILAIVLTVLAIFLTLVALRLVVV